MNIRERLRKKALSKTGSKVVTVEIEDENGKPEKVAVVVRELGWGERQEMFAATRECFEERGESFEDADGSTLIGALLVYACELEDGTPLFEIEDLFDLFESPEPFVERLVETAIEVNPSIMKKAEEVAEAEEAEAPKSGGNDESASAPPKKQPRSRRRKRRR